MKRRYVRPLMTSEVFVANEYVAACWLGECNVAGNVYLDTNGNGVYDEGIDEYKYRNSQCGEPFDISGIGNGIENAEQLHNAFVVGEHRRLDWVYIGTGPITDRDYYIPVWNTYTDTVNVYNFNGTHVSTIDSIRRNTENPNMS